MMPYSFASNILKTMSSMSNGGSDDDFECRVQLPQMLLVIDQNRY